MGAAVRRRARPPARPRGGGAAAAGPAAPGPVGRRRRAGPRRRPPRAREDLRRAILGAAQVAPILLVLDDLHWADDATLGAVRHLAPSLPGAAVLLVATVRDEAVPAGGAVAGRSPPSPATPARHADRPAGAGRDPSGRTGDLGAGRCAERLGRGHPVRDRRQPVLRRVAPPAPARVGRRRPRLPLPVAVRDVVGQRVGRLPEPTQALLRVASLFEGGFGLGAVAVAADLDEADALDAIDEAVRAPMIEAGDGPDAYEFVHAIARHAIAGTVPPSRRGAAPPPHRRGARGHQRRRAGPARVRRARRPVPPVGVAPRRRARRRARPPGGRPRRCRRVAADRTAAYLGMALDLLAPGDDRRSTITARRGLALIAATRYDEGAAIVVDAADAMAAAGATKAAAALLADGAWAADLAGCTSVAYALAAAGVPSWPTAPRTTWGPAVPARPPPTGGPRSPRPRHPHRHARAPAAARMLHGDARFRATWRGASGTAATRSSPAAPTTCGRSPRGPAATARRCRSGSGRRAPPRPGARSPSR